MPTGLWNLEWLTANSQRRYPLAVAASGVDSSASFTLPNSFIVELDLPIHAGVDVDSSRFFILNLGVYATGFSIIVGYQPAVGEAVRVASSLIPRDGFVPNTAYVLGGIGDYADTIGKIVIGKIDEMDEQPAGFFTFTLANAVIDPDCIRPMIRGVVSVAVVNGADTSDRLYGDIELVAGDNFQLVVDNSDPDNPRITMSAIDATGLEEPCVCVDDAVPPIRRINGIPPTIGGDFTLLGSSCLEMESITNGIKIKDICSEPCCGCQELEAITRDLEQFGSQATTLENFLVRLEASVQTMDQTVLGSKLNDQGCLECE